MVEFALVLPILLLLAVGIMDFGRALFVYSEVSNAAREAVRYAAVNSGNCVEITNRARSMFSLTPSGSIAVSIQLERPINGGFSSETDWCNANSETEVHTDDRIKITVSTYVSLLSLQLIAPLIGGLRVADLPIVYTAARSVVPPEGIATGPTTTPRPTRTLAPLTTATLTPIPTPPAPATFIATSTCAANGKQDYPVNASWQPAAGADGYRIYKLPDNTQVWAGTVTNVNGFTDVAPDTSTTFYVVAHTASGEGPRSIYSTVLCGSPTNTPLPPATSAATPTTTPTITPTPLTTDTSTPMPTHPAPANFIATSACTAHGNQDYPVNASWLAAAGATGYRIYKLPDNTQVWAGTATNVNGFTDVAPDTSTTFYVAAYNASGEGPRSTYSTVTCGAAPTNTPTITPTPLTTETTTPTPTPTITPTAPTTTPTPTDTSTASTSTPTPTPTPTPTLQPLFVSFAPGYPVHKVSGNAVKEMFVKVVVTTTTGITGSTFITDAVVIISAPVTTYTLTYLGANGAYGQGTDCWSLGTTADTFIMAQAAKAGYQTATVGTVTTSSNAEHCP